MFTIPFFGNSPLQKEIDFRMGAESCQWISMQTVAPLYPRFCTLLLVHQLFAIRIVDNRRAIDFAFMDHFWRVDYDLSISELHHYVPCLSIHLQYRHCFLHYIPKQVFDSTWVIVPS